MLVDFIFFKLYWKEPNAETSLGGFFFLRFYLFIFRERGRGVKGKERERNIDVWLPLVRPLLGTWAATQARSLTGNRTSDPLVPRSALNPLSHTSQLLIDFRQRGRE